MYAIGMRLTFHNGDAGDVSVDGVGLSTFEFDASSGGVDKRASAVAFAQKTARSAAMQRAFEKVSQSQFHETITSRITV